MSQHQQPSAGTGGLGQPLERTLSNTSTGTVRQPAGYGQHPDGYETAQSQGHDEQQQSHSGGAAGAGRGAVSRRDMPSPFLPPGANRQGGPSPAGGQQTSWTNPGNRTGVTQQSHSSAHGSRDAHGQPAMGPSDASSASLRNPAANAAHIGRPPSNEPKRPEESSQSNGEARPWGSPFPSLHLWPLNETFTTKMIHLPPVGSETEGERVGLVFDILYNCLLLVLHGLVRRGWVVQC